MKSALDSSMIRRGFASSTPMERGTESGRPMVGFRASGWARFLPAGFLAIWLCGWAAGEGFAGGALVLGLLHVLSPGTRLPFGIQAPHVAGVGAWLLFGFLTFWLVMWTVGGLAALTTLLDLLFLRERLLYDGNGIRVERRTLWLSVREWPADAIEGFFLSRTGAALEVQSRGRRHRLLTLGTPAERLVLRDELRARFGRGPVSTPQSRELPKGWESWLDTEGATVLSRSRPDRARQAWVMGVLALGSAAVAAFVVSLRGVSALLRAEFWVPVLILFVPFTAGALWLAFGGTTFRIRSGSVEFHRWFFGRVWSETLRPTSLELNRRIDSDNDEHISLDVREGARIRRVHSAMNDLETVRSLARWLAAQTGQELKIAPGLDLDE